MSGAAPQPATIGEFLQIPEDRRFHELVGGEIVEKATPSGEHGDAQAGIVGAIRPAYQRRSRDGGPGGWWIATEVEVLLESALLGSAEVVRPDVLGWRRERVPTRPVGFPVSIRPDWICEVVSPANANTDTVKKLRVYHRANVVHYWLVDPRDATLTVMRWTDAGYTMVLRAERGETVRPEPFDGIELVLGTLFGDDPPE
ncbi:MAG: Uma2 family endonuclease [Myxococcales bacterium]|nr:Uma2 family endonuclease [Myxococcales bacterium]